MLKQEDMIARTRRVCREDERLVAAMMYGSFAQGTGDEFSDIEFILFFEDDELEGLDQEEWVSRISPVALYFVNEYGNGTAIFENLVRGEFHFDRASDIETMVGEAMRDADWLPSLDDALVLDRAGELTRRLRKIVGPPPRRDTPEQVRFVCDCFVNWFVFGANLFARGEHARSLDLLGMVKDRLLQMVRVLEGSTLHWVNASKFLEREISTASYARYAACTARANEDELRAAYRAAWEWGRELMSSLAERHAATPPDALLQRLDGRFAATFGRREAERVSRGAKENPWRTLGSRPVYENPWISVREDSVVRPDGERGIYGVVHYKNIAVGVLPIEDDHIYLVGQYRYPLGRYSWEIPEGGCPEDEEPLGAARRELREETGLEAKSWRRLGEAYLSNSVADEYAVWFLATDLVPGEQRPEGTEVIGVRRVPLREALAMAMDGRITDALSALALTTYALDGLGNEHVAFRRGR